MGNPTAAQEPSMEEILASIRQIISEDGEGPDDEASEDGAAEASAEPAESADHADETSDDEAAESSDESDEEEDESGDVTDEVTDPEPEATENTDESDDEEIGPDATAIGFDAMDAAPQSEEPEEDDLIRTGPYESPFDTFQEKTVAAASVEDAAEPVHDDHIPPEAKSDSHFLDDSRARNGPAMAESFPTTQPEQNEQKKSASSSEITESQTMTATAPKQAEYTGDDKLISADAGASVANAFSTLTHTILSQNARTLDDLVSDMLQPMLKEWLDDNLPTLVERLVKQEIDRMARGGRV